MAVYLLHFERKLFHAQHYMGFATNVKKRVQRHRDGNGAKLVAAFAAQGIDFVIARIWPDADRTEERRLKNWKKAKSLCPICKEHDTEALELPTSQPPESNRV